MKQFTVEAVGHFCFYFENFIMAKFKEKWNPTITHIVSKGTKLADGTILDKETTLTQEEFANNPPRDTLFMIYGLR